MASLTKGQLLRQLHGVLYHAFLLHGRILARMLTAAKCSPVAWNSPTKAFCSRWMTAGMVPSVG